MKEKLDMVPPMACLISCFGLTFDVSAVAIRVPDIFGAPPLINLILSLLKIIPPLIGYAFVLNPLIYLTNYTAYGCGVNVYGGSSKAVTGSYISKG